MTTKKHATGGGPVALTGTMKSIGDTDSIAPDRAKINPEFDINELVNDSLTTSNELDAERRRMAEEAERARVQEVLLQEGSHDEGNAQCVVALYPGRFAANAALGWLHFDGRRWTRDGAEAAVERAIVETLNERIIAALAAGAEKHERLIKACIPNQGRVRGAKYLLQSLVTIPTESLDNDPDLLNTPGGVIDLRTGELRARADNERFTHCTAVDYDPGADQSQWVNWLTDTVGAELADWLQLAVGYTLTGHTREEILFYVYGPPRAGKGLFAETLLTLFGRPLSATVNFATFTAQRTGDSQNFDLAPLRPTRLVIASESNAYERFNEAKVKALTGGDEIYCAFKHRDHFNYRPRFKIWLLSNQPVNADPDDDAVWERVRLVHFPNSYIGQEDKTLKDRFKQPENLRGVLAWAVAGARRWYALGPRGIPETEAGRALKDKQRRALDNVGLWLDERTTQTVGAFTPHREAYQDYKQWALENGIEPKRAKAFTTALERKGIRKELRRLGNTVSRGFIGLKLTRP